MRGARLARRVPGGRSRSCARRWAASPGARRARRRALAAVARVRRHASLELEEEVSHEQQPDDHLHHDAEPRRPADPGRRRRRASSALYFDGDPNGAPRAGLGPRRSPPARRGRPARRSTSRASAPASICRSRRGAPRSRRRCGRRCCRIPFGETASYGDIARAIGKPAASRAVGGANDRNPIAIVMPCHRVIGADGSLTGYGGGLDHKRLLLELESRVRSARPRAASTLRDDSVSRSRGEALIPCFGLREQTAS